MASRPTQPNSDDNTGIFVIPALIVFVLVLFWNLYKESLYWYSGVMARAMLKPFSFIERIEAYRNSITVHIMSPPDLERAFDWVTAAWRFPTFLLFLLCCYIAWKAWKHPIALSKGGFRGALTVDALMRYQAQVHPAIAPIVPIAKKMHLNEDQRWHEAYHPHEVVKREGLAKSDGTLDIEKTEKYFIKQLGKRIYRPGIDQGNEVFADRLGNYEKVIFALLAPLAINLKDGLKEYQVVADQLAYSAVNATQTPDLRIANELYQRYRTHPKLNNLFKFHHFSTTFLMQLYILAKRAGKVTTADWCGWLRPNANELYAALNCAGRATPFTECGGPFFQWKFELYCRDKGYMPVLINMAGMAHSLKEEWDFWQGADKGVTEESLWGRMTQEQSSHDQGLFRRHVTDLLKPNVPPETGEDTAFDIEQRAARLKKENEDLEKLMSGLSHTFPADSASGSKGEER